MTEGAVVTIGPTEARDAPLLDVRDLRTYFKTDDGTVKAVDGVSFSVRPGQTLGVVGESGSGKSVTMMSLLDLNPKPGRLALQGSSPPGEQMEAFLRGTKKHTSISTGQALFRGENLLEASKRRLRALRGSEISMIFQDPMTSLNPVLSIGDQLVEAVMLHRDISARKARELAIAGLDEVGIPARGAADRRLSAPVLGRHAPARDDRDGAHQRPGPADRRRADDGARRDDAGADPRAASGSSRRSTARPSSSSPTTSASSRRPQTTSS